MIILNAVCLDGGREKGGVGMSWWSSFFQLESKFKRNNDLRNRSNKPVSVYTQDKEVVECNARETQTRLQHQQREQSDQIRLEQESKQERFRLDEERRIDEQQRSHREY